MCGGISRWWKKNFARVALPNGNSTDFQVLLNLGTEPVTTHCAGGRVILTTVLDGAGSETGGEITVEGGEGLLIALDMHEDMSGDMHEDKDGDNAGAVMTGQVAPAGQ